MTPLIAQGDLTQTSLAGRIAVVTGAGGGIGYEAARALLWLGARVVIAEIVPQTGRLAARRLHSEFKGDRVLFVKTDVGDEHSVARMARKARRVFGIVDIVVNNATIAPLGAVKDVPIAAWDASYRVNLRGPVLLAQAFLPGMLDKKWGVFVCVSSVGQAYMAAYEAIKAAQVHIGTTLDAELTDTGVVAFVIGPGFVPTATASVAIPRLAALMGQPVDELRDILAAHTLSVEAAGTGFAAAVALAERYRGQEISSVQALIDAGIPVPDRGKTSTVPEGPAEVVREIAVLAHRIRAMLAEQFAGWQERNLFERQWMLRTFRNDAGMPAEEWLASLESLAFAAEAGDSAAVLAVRPSLNALSHFFHHQFDLARGYIRSPAERTATLQVVRAWMDDVDRLDALVQSL